MNVAGASLTALHWRPYAHRHRPPRRQLIASAQPALEHRGARGRGSVCRASTRVSRRACRICLACSAKGRVVVTGMGKSGHIAGKIAATLASTGTPAFFLHPAERAMAISA